MSLQYVIDGYNIINHPLFVSAPRTSCGPQTSLVLFIKSKHLTGSSKNKLDVVFDGYPPRDWDPKEWGTNLRVIFSRKISADDKIKMIVEESANRGNIVVVSDDKEVRFMAKALGASCLGVSGFIGAKDNARSHGHHSAGNLKEELTYIQMSKINQELFKRWISQ